MTLKYRDSAPLKGRLVMWPTLLGIITLHTADVMYEILLFLAGKVQLGRIK